MSEDADKAEEASQEEPSKEASSREEPSRDASSSEAPSGEEPPGDDAPSLEDLGDRDAIFEALWKRCLEAWEDDKPHAAILEHSLKSEKLPDLAGRYRKLKDDPEKGARAQKKIDGIVVAATQMLMATKTPAVTKTPWQWTAAAVAFFVIVISYLVYALVLPHHRGGSYPPQ